MTTDNDFQVKELVDTVEFELYAVFDKTSRDPQRIFKSLSELITALQEIDRIFLQAIDPDFEAELLLGDVEIGSIRTILKTFIKSLPDEGLLSLDYKRVLGQYLVNCKYVLLKWLDGKYVVNGRTDLNVVIGELFKEATSVSVTQIPAPTPVPAHPLVKAIQKIHNSLNYLHVGDSIEFVSNRGNVPFNKALQTENLDTLLIEQSESYNNIMILKVKMPDYLGDRMWEFKYDAHVIQAKIAHFEWLNQFQQGNIELVPGDSLRAEVDIIVDYGFDKEVMHKHYTVKRIISVLHQPRANQRNIFE